MKVRKSVFGSYQEEEIYTYELENDNGMILKVMTFGATITSLSIPDSSSNKRINLVCGFDRFGAYFSEEYVNNEPYFGCTIGRYCSQIKDAEFYMDEKEFLLAANCGDNNLHGGAIGFDKMIWTSESFEEKDAVGVNFKLESPEWEEGFPGKVKVQTTMTLNNANEIRIDYKAKTTKKTPLSFTNHSYFNLSGFKESIEKHKVSVYANKLQVCDETGVGTGEISIVDGTHNDLQAGRLVEEVHQDLGDGLEHFYVFDNPDFQLNKVAEVSDPVSGRSLEVFSKEPCMLLYTAKNMSDKLHRESGDQYGKYRAFACATHRWQNGPNIAGSPGTFTAPEKPFESTTVFKLNY